MEDLPDLITSRDLGSRRSSLTRWLRQGRYVRCYRGVYARAEHAQLPAVRLGAAAAANPNGFFIGAEVFSLFGGDPLGPGPLTMTGPCRRSYPGLEVMRYTVAPEWRYQRAGLWTVRPALAAAYLAGFDGGRGIDRYLRAGGRIADVNATLDAVARWGYHGERRRVVEASRAEPWSWAEREYHQLLWRHHIDGWVANHRVIVRGHTYFVDIAFRDVCLALEIDGFDVHSSRMSFERDRERQNALVLAGWTVLRFTVAQLSEPDLVAATIRRALNRLRRRAD